MSTANVRVVFTGLDSSGALAFDAFLDGDSEGLFSAFGKFVVDLAVGVQDIEPERAYDNNPITSLPPCDALAFAMIIPASIFNVVICFRSHLEKYFDASYIVALEEEHFSLRNTYNKEDAFRTMLDVIDSEKGFCEA